jgi:hypothetical protein
MKVIKVGTSAQSRIAQACDRCRSKKIRCDGTRPTCSQCANVGFECRTSDKLSRRAFPRGYTESLEERVRLLECEIRELKDLLDEKDEKIDMLSAMHSGSHAHRRPSASASSCSPPMLNGADSSAAGTNNAATKDAHVNGSKEDTFRVQASQLLHGVENSDAYFMGAASGRTFISMFLFHPFGFFVSFPFMWSVSEIFLTATRANYSRNSHFQAQTARNRQAMQRVQSRGVPACAGLPATHNHSSRLFPTHPTTPIHRPLRQHLLPGVGASVPGFA